MREFNKEYKLLQLYSDSSLIKQDPYIHVDVYPAMTGITRFLYENHDNGWRYNRTEYLSDEQKLVFTHLFTDRQSVPGFKRFKIIQSFDKVDIKSQQVKFKNSMYIHERDDIHQERITQRSEKGTK